jgi:hypothetical protein
MSNDITVLSSSFETPILIIFWRRPSLAKPLMERLRELRPTRLFLACDGARSENMQEASQVEMSRRQFEQAIDWPCKVEKRYSVFNQGCKYGPGNAIDWFFKHVEEGIILEDDCLPHPSFFPYCQILLDRYRHDQRVWQISGNNFVENQTPQEASYSFTGYTTTWGWATWKRCWNSYDIEMQDWPAWRDGIMLANAFGEQDELDYWIRIWERLYSDNFPITWDYQWNYLCFTNGGLSILPKFNLVSNIGFGEGATNCFDAEDQRSRLESKELIITDHPKTVLRDWRIDRAIFESAYRETGSSQHGFLRTSYLRTVFTLQGILRRLSRR